MSKWKIIYYESIEGACPVEEFIDSRKINNKAKIFSLLTLLEEKGPNLARPYADLLKEGIHELRIKLSGDQIRFLYFFCYKDFIILTHAFNKKSKKVPEKEIKKAIMFRDDFLKRISESDLLEVYNENL